MTNANLHQISVLSVDCNRIGSNMYWGISVDGVILSKMCYLCFNACGEIFFEYEDEDGYFDSGEWPAFAARSLGGYIYWLAGAAGSLPSKMPWYFIFDEGQYMSTLPAGEGYNHVPPLDGLWVELLAVSLQLPRKEDVLLVLPAEAESLVKTVFEYWATTFTENRAWWISFMLGGCSRLSRIRAEVQTEDTHGTECEVYLDLPGTPSMKMWVKDNPDGIACCFIENPWIPIVFAGITSGGRVAQTRL